MQRPKNLRDALKGKLSAKELSCLITSFDSVGNIAVIEIPKELERKEKLIGEALLSLNKQFETVCKIAGEHKGRFRAQPVKVIAGKNNKTATYRESGCIFRVDLGKVFFSPRLSHERLRIAKLIKKGETVGAFFAGVGPYPIVFAKNSPLKKAYAVELNPRAFRQMQENIELNKVQHKIEAIKGDVKKIVPKQLKGKCDRIVMPLPKTAEHFLESAFIASNPRGCVIHFYAFVEKSEMFKQPLQKIREIAAELGYTVRVLRKAEVRSFSPAVVQVVVDFRAKTA